jgi:transcriptional regulator with XRE-family HTH domain
MLEKAKELRAIRKRLGWTQPKMAQALGLDFTYLSQLENGRRQLDDFYLERAREVARSFENSKSVKVHQTEEAKEIRRRCHAYLDAVMDSFQADVERLTWTLVELQRRLQPLNPRESSSSVSTLTEEEFLKRAAEGVKKADVVFGRSRKSGSPNDKAS